MMFSFLLEIQTLQAVLIGLVVFCVTVLVRNYYAKFKGLPPGPRGWPILGCLPYMSHEWQKDFTRLGKGYGDVFSLQLFTTPVVVLNSAKAMKETLESNAHAWAGRPHPHGFVITGFDPEVLYKDDYTLKFKARKKFAIATMKSFGYGSDMIEDKLQTSVDLVIEDFKQTKGKPFNLSDLLTVTVGNVFCSILLGKIFDKREKQYQQFLDDQALWMAELSVAADIDIVPSLRFNPRHRKALKVATEMNDKLKSFFENIISEHRSSYDSNNMRSYIDVCIKKGFEDKDILLHMFSLFPDATDTTPGVIRWWLLLITTYQDIQRKIQQEVDNVLKDKELELQDKQSLPFLEASIMESMRLRTTVPISLSLKTTENTSVCGYKIPKDTIFFANWELIHNDPTVWEEPTKFKPDRFILENGECDVKHSSWVGFGRGKRNCIGEPLARQVMFFVCASILKNFTLTFPDNEIPHLDKGTRGITNVPFDFKIVATPRKK